MPEVSHVLTVAEVRPETEDAMSIVFDVPEALAEAFAFTPGQFLTLAIPSELTGVTARCYSVCVPPGEPLTVTVKRTVDGYASNWLHENLHAGDSLRVLPPSGIFTPKDLDADLLLFAGGSGITPIMSIIRTALRDGRGQVVLLYANRDEASVIFGAALRDLAAEHVDRLQVVHWLESERGLPTPEEPALVRGRACVVRRLRLRPGPVHEGHGGGAQGAGVPPRPPPPGEVRLARRQSLRPG